jgi:hypothetical protein
MPVTVLGPTGSIPYATYPTVVQVRQTWSDDWVTVPGLYLESCSRCAGGHDLDEATLLWKYGWLKHPWDSELQEYDPLELDKCWVQVLLLDDQQTQSLWVGRVYGEGKNIEGVQQGVASGQQRFQCYGPGMLLRKRHVSRSLWVLPDDGGIELGSGDDDDDEDSGTEYNFVQWLAPMNDRVGQHHLLIGNRSSDTYDTPSGDDDEQTYVHGGTDLWSAADYLGYIFAWFADYSDDGGPQFVIGGQTDPLDDLKTCEEWGASVTVDEILRRIVNPKIGLDFSIDYDAADDCFTVNVFALQAASFSAAGATLPANPNTVTVQAGQTPANLSTHVATSSDHRARIIRVLGKRVVVCCTLGGPQADSNAGSGGDGNPNFLIGDWDPDLESDYDDGFGPFPDNAAYPAGSDQAKDFARRDGRYRDVYGLWIMPTSSDDSPPDLMDIDAAVWCDEDGDVQTTGPGDGDPPRQTWVRHTLRWLPLTADQDYTSWPPTQLTPPVDADNAPQFLPPQAWIKGWTDYRQAERASVHVQAARQGLGMRLECHPRHLIALGVFGGSSLTQPRWDARTIEATIAFESDARFSMEYENEDADACDGVMEIVVPDAELWVLAPGTAVGIDPGDPTKFTLSPSELYTLRDDTDRLALVLAGAIARYSQARARAEIVAAGICPWGGLLGQILTTVEAGGDSTSVQSPITQIVWTNALDGGLPRTTIRTGFAHSE